MNFRPQPHAPRRIDPVVINGMRTGLLGRVASARGVQVLATHGVPNGSSENRVTTDVTVLVYTPRMPVDATISRGRLPFRAVAALGLVGRGHSYTLRGGGPFTCSYCLFSPDFLAGLAETESRLRISDLNLVAPIESERLTYLGQEMWREAIAPGFAGGLFAEATGMAIAVEIARLDGLCGLDDEPGRGGLALWQMRRLESYIRAHLSDKLTLRELAVLIGVSVRRLSQAVKLTQGVSLHRWIAEHRVAEARRLLIETDLPVDEIGRRCAFQSVAAFSAAFRAAAGCAPGAFRRLILD
jgi:AraC-like DNA-binding protein